MRKKALLAMLLAILLGGGSGVLLTRWWVARTRASDRAAVAVESAPTTKAPTARPAAKQESPVSTGAVAAEHKAATPVPAASRTADKTIKEK